MLRECSPAPPYMCHVSCKCHMHVSCMCHMHVSCMCHISGVRCQVSGVRCNFFLSGEVSWWRVDYQRGLPRLVLPQGDFMSKQGEKRSMSSVWFLGPVWNFFSKFSKKVRFQKIYIEKLYLLFNLVSLDLTINNKCFRQSKLYYFLV